jgi:tetratricopeptide (TPR) repeat protein
LEALPAEWIHEHLGASAPSSVYDRSWLIQSLAQIGRFADAITYEPEVLGIAAPTRHPFTIGQAHRAVVTLYTLMGDWARARSLSEQWITGVRAGNVVIQLPWAVSSSAWILAQVGETSDALDRLREGEQLLERQAERKLVATAGWDYHSLGRACLSLGRLHDAQRLGEHAVNCSQHQLGYAAHGLHLLGDVATHPDRFDAESGESQYRKSLALAERSRMRPLVAHCQLGIGKIYRRTGRPKEARDLFTSASAMYDNMNMSFWATQAEAEMVTPA